MVVLDMEDKKQIRSLEKRRLKKFGWWKSRRGRRYLTRDSVERIRGILVESLTYNRQQEKMPGKKVITEFGYEADESKEMERKEESEDKLDMLDILVSEAENMEKEIGIVNLNECSKFVSDNVVNLSNRNLTEAEISLLSKGLKFCVTPRELDWYAIQKDLREFGGKLKCRA